MYSYDMYVNLAKLSVSWKDLEDGKGIHTTKMRLKDTALTTTHGHMLAVGGFILISTTYSKIRQI